MNTKTVAPNPDAIIIPLSLLIASTFNPRKTFDDTAMKELTASIKAQGVLQPITVRPHPTKKGSYEVVAGERRFRAATAAKVDTVPATVHQFNDHEALIAAVTENGQRKDVHPLEEAEGYEALRQMPGPGGEKYTIADIAAKVGRPPSFVVQRLKFCALCPEARKAFISDELDARKAFLIARIAHHDTQREALRDITKGVGQYQNERRPLSYSEAHAHVLRTYILKLKEAPFDPQDAALLPKVGACGPCPKRTGNQSDLFGDVKNVDMCTDPKCFDDKRQAHFGVAVKEQEAKGRKVIYGDAAKKIFPHWESTSSHQRDWMGNVYVEMASHCWNGNRQVSVRDVMGPEYSAPLLQHPGTGKMFEVVAQQAVQNAIAKSRGAKKAAGSSKAKVSGPKGPDVDEQLTDRLAEIIFAKAPKTFNRKWLADLTELVVKHVSTRDMSAVRKAWGWKAPKGFSSRELPSEVDKLNERDLVLFMFMTMFAIGQWNRAPILKLFGVNEKQVREKVLEDRKAAARKAREEAKAQRVKAAKEKPAKAKAKAKKGKA